MKKDNGKAMQAIATSCWIAASVKAFLDAADGVPESCLDPDKAAPAWHRRLRPPKADLSVE